MSKHIWLFRLTLSISWVLCSLVLASCARSSVATAGGASSALPTPTLSSLFSTPPSITPIEQQPVVTTAPEPTEEATLQPTETFDQQLTRQFVRSFIYSDTLDSNWTLKNSYLVEYDTKSKAKVDQGNFAIQAKPKVGTTTLLFAAKQNTKKPLLRKRVAGIRFRLNGGKNIIANDAVTVAVLGSNAKNYWVVNDTSVSVDRPVTPEAPRFSETRLYYLGFDYSIPADTWVDVVVWLNELRYDPMYLYVTGIQLKVDQAVLPEYFVDQVEVLLWPDDPAPAN